MKHIWPTFFQHHYDDWLTIAGLRRYTTRIYLSHIQGLRERINQGFDGARMGIAYSGLESGLFWLDVGVQRRIAALEA